MSKKTIKKAIAGVMSAALIFTSVQVSGKFFASDSKSESPLVESELIGDSDSSVIEMDEIVATFTDAEEMNKFFGKSHEEMAPILSKIV